VDTAGRRHLCRIPGVAVAEAEHTGCPLVHACVLLDLESSGGLNVFGVPKRLCGQPANSPVSEATYTAYKARRDECGSQGVGPLQLTWPPYQDAAEAFGGCWKPEINVRYGLQVFAGHLRRDTVAEAYSRWNTGRPDPSPYADKALALLPHWQLVIDG
jgi:hypothetical protein